MTLTIFADTFAARKKGLDRDLIYGYHSRATRNGHTNLSGRIAGAKEDITDVLDAVQTVVDSLTGPDGGRYSVTFGKAGGVDIDVAATSLSKRQIGITAGPLFDKALRMSEIAEVLTGLTCHEIGHAFISEATGKRVEALWGQSPLAHMVANLLDDVALEKMMSRDYPGIAGTFRPACRWVARSMMATVTDKVLRFDAAMPLVDRANFAIDSVRYAPFFRWVGDKPTRRERAWWQQWADDFADPDSVDTRIRGIEAGLVHLRDTDEPEDETPPPPKRPKGKGEGGDGEGESLSKPKPEIDEAEDPIDGDGDGDEDEDEDLDDDEDGDGDDLDDADEEARHHADETDEDWHDAPEASEAPDSYGSGADPVQADDLSAEQASRLRPTIDKVNDERDLYLGREVQNVIDEARVSERITTDGFGAMRVVEIDDKE